MQRCVEGVLQGCTSSRRSSIFKVLINARPFSVGSAAVRRQEEKPHRRAVDHRNSDGTTTSSGNSSKTERPENSRARFSDLLGPDRKLNNSKLEARATVLRPSDPARQREDHPQEIVAQPVSPEDLGKLRICRKYGLQPRDLGTLDTGLVARRAQIFVRPGSIVFSVATQAVITAKEVLMLEPLDEDNDARSRRESEPHIGNESDRSSHIEVSPAAQQLASDMRRLLLKDKLAQPDKASEATPFEFIALEALLAQSMHGLMRDSENLQNRFGQLMEDFRKSESISTLALQTMVEIKDAAEDFQSRADDFKSAVDDILREEADMAAMYLTDQANGKPRKIGEDDEVELLFESYRHYAYSLSTVASSLLMRLATLNNHVTLLLSSTRNRLLNLEITIAFATLGVSVAAFVGAIFGMNLTSGLEDKPHLFAIMTSVSFILALLVIRLGRRALVKARTIKGEQHGLLQQPSVPVRTPRRSK